MTKIILSFILFFGTYTLQSQVDIQIDTLKTINEDTYVIYSVEKGDGGSEHFQAESYVIKGIAYEVIDTTFTLSKSDDKSVFFDHKGDIDQIYTVINNIRYQNRLTGFDLTTNDKVRILKQIYTNIHYPKRAREMDIEGKVMLEFYLNDRGCIDDIVVRRSTHKLLSKESKRAARKCDCQFPVFDNGKVRIASALMLPITFRLE